MDGTGHERGRVLVAMSGGVDSAVAALLLRRQGRDVMGVFVRNGVTREGAGASRSCCSISDAADARKVASLLDVPFYAIDAEEPFQGIVAGFVAAYREGRTPNPCVRCNSEVKFGSLLELADRVGAATVATGHYARVRAAGGRHVLAESADSAKDQSYVLSTLRQEQLARAEFPLGELRKDEVRRLAREAGLPVAAKAESQEICFVPSGDYRDLLAENGGGAGAPGEIVTVDGTVLGDHPGVAHFTVGQRKGLGVAVGAPLHVVRLEPETKRVVVGRRDDACSHGFTIHDPNWILVPPAPPSERFEVRARVRHRHAGASAIARATASGGIRVDFERPEFAVTQGQTAVLYVGADVLAAGTIDRSWQEDRRAEVD
jgi:tRNA-specific 2-thiouridylase